MITTTHAVLNAALLGRKEKPTRHWPLILGAVLPDLPMFLLFFWRFVQDQTHSPMGIHLYYSPLWRDWVDWLHSIPLALAGALLCFLIKNSGGVYFFVSMALHDLEDFPVHAEFAHRHFLPFSNYRYYGPISYWNPEHYGNIVAPLEWILVLVCIGVLWRRGLSPTAQIGLLFLGVFQGLWLIYFYGKIHW